jgi:hypothetical protein
MAEAKIIYNPDRSRLSVELPDESAFEVQDTPDDGFDVFTDDSGNQYLAVFDDDFAGLEPDTVYQLVPVATLVEEAEDFDDDGEPITADEEETQG